MKIAYINLLPISLGILLLAGCHSARLENPDDESRVDKLRLVYEESEDLATQVGVTVSDDGTKMAMAYDNQNIQVLDLRSGKLVNSIQGEFSDLFEIRFSSDGKKLLSFDGGGSIVAYDLKSGSKYRARVEESIAKVATGSGNVFAVSTYREKNAGVPLPGVGVTVFEIDEGLSKKKFFYLNGSFAHVLAFEETGQNLIAATSRFNQGEMSLYLLDMVRLTASKQDIKLPYFVDSLRYYPERDLFVLGGQESVNNYFIEMIIRDGRVIETTRQQAPTSVLVSGARDFIVKLFDFVHTGINTCVVNYDNSFLCFGPAYEQVTFATLRSRHHNVAMPNAGGAGEPTRIYPLYDGKSFLVSYDIQNENINQIFDSEKMQFTSFIYSDGSGELAIVARDGRMEGTSDAISNVYWSEHKSDKRVPLEATFDQFYTPNLLQEILAGDTRSQDVASLEKAIDLAPLVDIVSPANNLKTGSDNIAITVNATPKGDPIKEIKVFANGKPLQEEQRGLKIASSTTSKTVTVPLLPGRSIISAVAVSEGGYQSAPDQIIVDYQGRTATSKLFVLVVGIDEYKNPSYNLNYATADASAFTEEVQQKASGIFEDIEVTYIKNDQAIKQNVSRAIQSIKDRARLQDAFVFYYAGHGVMSEGSQQVMSDFYLALHDVTRLYGQDQMLAQKGISAAELRDIFASIEAQKQLIVLDACQSGGAVETFAVRGAAEEKAMLQLARSSGVVLLASTGSEQFATEFEQLGHGVFTYAILQGIGGEADSGDRKVTVKELEAYLNDAVPELNQQYKGTVQYPRSWSRGMDFPIAVVEE